VVSEWLRFYGPTSRDFAARSLGLARERLDLVLSDLLDAEQLIEGSLTEEGEGHEICDSGNFELLLRLRRSRATPAFEPRPVGTLPAFLADFQGVRQPARRREQLHDRLEQLLCYPADAELWESEILPARLHPYRTHLLDGIIREGEVRWVGAGKGRVAFCLDWDLDLVPRDAPNPESDTVGEGVPEPEELFQDPDARYGFAALLKATGKAAADLSDLLWTLAWQGAITNDTFDALRKGVQLGFELSTPGNSARWRRSGRARRAGGNRGRERSTPVPWAGNWFVLPREHASADRLEAEERNKDRVRLLLDRYGILFRELLQREPPQLRWSSLFRSLRLMELSGEVLAGCFFEGIQGLQFMSTRAFRRFQQDTGDSDVYWINAADPASACGLHLESLKGELPRRVPSTHLVYRGSSLVLVSGRNGRDLDFRIPPDDPQLSEVLRLFEHLLGREFKPLGQITVESICGEHAADSPYLVAFQDLFQVIRDYRQVKVFRRVG